MYGKIIIVSRVIRVNSSIVRYQSRDSSKRLLELLGNMPKEKSGKIFEAQKQRQLNVKKNEKYAPSTVYLQVLGSGARGAPNTLYVFTDQKRYLFNCGEGTQRLAHEHKVKLSKLEHIFITNKTWQNIGGLPGLSLTLQDVGVPNITLHGPEGLDELYYATRRFIVIKEMNVTMAKCSPSNDFEDNVMTVKYVFMNPNDSILETDPKPEAKKPKLNTSQSEKEYEEFIHDDTDYYRRDRINEFKDLKPKSEKDSLTSKTTQQKVLSQLQKQSNCSVAYICTLKKRFGTLDLEKCVQFGVKPGPMLGQLKSGQDVVLPDGKLVRSRDVKTPDDPGPVFIVLEVPELSYLKESEFKTHFDNGTNPPENIPVVVVHYSPPHVFNHPTYREFMKKFGPTTRHMVLNTQNTCLGSESVHRTQQKLHLLDSDMFPLLRDVSIPAVWSPLPPREKPADPLRLRALEELKQNVAMAQFQDIIKLEGSCGGDAGLNSSDSMAKLDLIAGRTLSIFHLRPKKELDRSVEPKLHIQEYIQETMDIDGFVPSLEHFRQLVEDKRYVKSDSQKEYPKVVFLGTGSSIPSKTRNTSAIVLQVDKNSSMLLDCGEGTFGQLVRFYGPKRVNDFLKTLKAIYISHLHADHHIGLIGVLQARQEAFADTNSEETPLYLLAPGQIVTWLSMYDEQFERIRDKFTLIPNQNLLDFKLSESTNTDMTSAVLASIGVQYIRTCLVAHCPNAFGVAIDVDHEYKVTYSGDTIPCDELVDIGKNSTLLIHEATMEDELAEEARIKMHSTTSQAIEIGRKMNAKYTVLTHFSQRYARLPRLNAHILNDNRSIGIAFDNMQITMSDLELLPHMYAPLQLMYAEHCVELELKAAQRARLKERRPSPPSFPTSAPREKSPCHTSQSAPNKPVVIRDKSIPSRKSSPSRDTVSEATENNSHVIYIKHSNTSRLRKQRGRATAKIITELRSNSCTRDKSVRNSLESSPCRSAYQSRQNSPSSSPYSSASQSSNPAKNNKMKYQKTQSCDTERVDSPPILNKSPISGSSPPHTTAKITQNMVNSLPFTNKRTPQPVKKSRSPVMSWRGLEKSLPQGLSSNNQDTKVRRSSANAVASRERVRRPRSRPNVAVMKSVPIQNYPGSLASYNKTKPTHVAYTRNTTNWNTGTFQKHIRSRLSPARKLSFTKENVPKNQDVNSTSPCELSTVKKKKPLDVAKTPLPVRKFPYYIGKSFKPQLEDIKSSFLILNNEKNIDENMECQDQDDNASMKKPQQLSEKQRKDKLLQAMKKFKSKKFWLESKYDRIEGLNWISWK